MEKDNEKKKEFGDKDILENLYHREFSGDLNKLALALGRDAADIRNILDGDGTIDEDLSMKIRGIAQERNAETD
jgi:plasmid maintenance system antidote protein VapI